MPGTDFVVGQRVISAPGLHWLPVQRAGTVINVTHEGVVVYFDHPCSRSGSKDKRRLFLAFLNILPLE